MKNDAYPYARKAVIIGGGIAGLAVSALLGKAGWHVTLLEKNTTLGGRARTLRTGGFRFDMGPSWYMMPEIFERFFGQFGKKTADYYTLTRVNPRYRVYFGSGDTITLTDDLQHTLGTFNTVAAGSGEQLLRFLNTIRQTYVPATGRLIYQNIYRFSSWIRPGNLRDLFSVGMRIPLWKNWDRFVGQYIRDESLRKILTFPAVFLGGSPFSTPAMYSLLSWADFGTGVWYPAGGMGKVVDALRRLAIAQGVVIRTGCEVKEIILADGRVSGVRTAQRTYPADVIVGATDLAHLETELLPKTFRSGRKAYWDKRAMGISALLLYLGVKRRIPGLVHHSLYFSADWKQNFSDIFERKRIPADPSFYLSARSVTDRSIAPANSEELFVLVPLPSRPNFTERELRELSATVIGKIEAMTGVSLRQQLSVYRKFTPRDFMRAYNAYRGTALGLAHTFRQSLWFRPSHRNQRVPGLFYAGQYTNPGVGVPMALVSAQLAAKEIGSAADVLNGIFRKGSATFYNASRFFRGQVKQDVFALYAYVRVIDDWVDTTKPHIADMNRMWQETRRAWRTGTCTDPIVRGFIEVAQRRGFRWEWIAAFWNAMRSDLKKRHYRSFAELEQYMFGSAEVIGLMMARIMELPEPALKTAALHGKAMQYVNFIRDVSEDRQLGRNYLDYTDADLRDPQRWAKFLRTHIDRYTGIMHEAQQGYWYLPRRYRIPIKTAADMYQWTIDRIRHDPGSVWITKHKPGKWRIMASILVNAVSDL